MRSRIAGDTWDDDEPTISIVMAPDDASEPRLEIGEEDFIRMEPSASDWRLAPPMPAPDPEAIPRPPKVPRIAHIVPADRVRTPPPSRSPAQEPAQRRQLPQGRRPKPPPATLPKFSTNTNPDLAVQPIGRDPPAVPLVNSRSAATQRPSPRGAGSASPAAELVVMTPSAPPVSAPSAPPAIMTPSAPPATPAPPMISSTAPPATPQPPQAMPSAYPAYGSPGTPGAVAAPRAPSSLWSVSPLGVIAAVGAAVVAALATVALMVWLTQPSPSKPVRVDPPPPAAPTHQASAAPVASAPSAAPAPPASSAPGVAAAASSSSSSLAALAAKGDIDAWMQIRARKPEDRTADESLALARGRTVRKRAALDELAQRLRADLPLSADRDNLAKLREYLDDGETATEALAVLTSIGTPMAVDMIFDVGSRAPARSDTRAVVDDLLASKDLRAAASPALAVVLDLREVASCDDAWRILPRAIESADRRALADLERLRVRTGCGRYKSEDCYRCLRGNDDLDKAIKAAKGRAAPGM